MAIKYIDQADFKDKKVIARFDFNVPFKKDGTKEISDTKRIDSALPTIKHILEKGAAKLILMSHLGEPKGKVNMDLSLEPVAKYLAAQLNTNVLLTESCTDAGIKTLLNLNESKVILLQNLRFHKEETENDVEFSKKLASYADIYVNDAFGTAHRKHASTYGVAQFFKNKCYAGFLMQKEIEALDKVVNRPEKPFVAVMGGAKISDKIKILERLIVEVDHLLVGGAMSYPFLKAQGKSVGKSLCNDEDVELAKRILAMPSATKLHLPSDHMVATGTDGAIEGCPNSNIPNDRMGLDIGPKTIAEYARILASAKTVIWNGPMGFFENEVFAKGTFEIARILSETKAFTLVGGGDSASAVKKSGLSKKMSHVSTGGGASLEYIELAGALPGIQALKF